MSEFSDSYHLAVSNPTAAVALLERAHRAGWIVASSDAWVSFVVGEDFDTRFDPALAAANEHVLVHFVNAEDHGCGIQVFDGVEDLGSLWCDWNDGPVNVKRDNFNDSYVSQVLARVIPEDAVAAALEELTGADANTLMDDRYRNPGHRFAERVGLPAYEWLSGHYAAISDDDERATWMQVEGGSGHGESQPVRWLSLAEMRALTPQAVPLRPPGVDVPSPDGLEMCGRDRDGRNQSWSYMASLDAVDAHALADELERRAAANGYEVERASITGEPDVRFSRWRGHGTTVEAAVDGRERSVSVTLTSPIPSSRQRSDA